MDWTQTFTIIGSITASMIAVWYAFYNITDKRMDKMEQNMQRLDNLHREDIQRMDEKWERMDSKWERLFERLLIQDQQKIK
jgi:hypothetical protein